MPVWASPPGLQAWMRVSWQPAASIACPLLASAARVGPSRCGVANCRRMNLQSWTSQNRSAASNRDVRRMCDAVGPKRAAARRAGPLSVLLLSGRRRGVRSGWLAGPFPHLAGKCLRKKTARCCARTRSALACFVPVRVASRRTRFSGHPLTDSAECAQSDRTRWWGQRASTGASCRSRT